MYVCKEYAYEICMIHVCACACALCYHMVILYAGHDNIPYIYIHNIYTHANTHTHMHMTGTMQTCLRACVQWQRWGQGSSSITWA